MEELSVNLKERSYPILMGEDLYLNRDLYPEGFGKKILVLSDRNVFPLYGEMVLEVLSQKGWDPISYVVESGEESKSLSVVERIYDGLIQQNFDRFSPVLALGGGVVGDLAGFISSTYLRGIPFFQFPTTLLAMVDSSVGGKVGVNHPKGKNLIGSFYQPQRVVMDTSTLKTLSKREFQSGLVEAMKYGMIWDEDLFFFFEENLTQLFSYQRESLIHVIKRSCAIKAEIVSLDEREEGLRAILNYGHTLGHALEAGTNYQGFTHGEAVAIGISFALYLAQNLQLIENALAVRQRSLLEKAGLSLKVEGISSSKILKHMYQDKKRVGRSLRFVLPVRLGEVKVMALEDKIIKETLQSFLKEGD